MAPPREPPPTPPGGADRPLDLLCAALILIFAPVIGWIGFVPGILRAMFMRPRGCAGWSVTTRTDLALGAGLAGFGGPGGTAPFADAVLAGFCWIALRLIALQAFTLWRGLASRFTGR